MIDKLKNDLKKAMKTGDKEKLNPLRNLISKIKMKEIEKGDSLTEAESEKICVSSAKKIKESISQFEAGKRYDLAEIEKKELKVIQNYIPEQLSVEKIIIIVKKIIEETSSSGKSDMGKVMSKVMQQIGNNADGKIVQKIVLSELK
tara:strand:- start:753 stop:1190 length:438 start_codon:yes stop_codon:yes gene_type:complete